MTTRPDPGDVVWSGHAHTRHHRALRGVDDYVETLCGLWMLRPRPPRPPDGREHACRTCLRIEAKRRETSAAMKGDQP